MHYHLANLTLLPSRDVWICLFILKTLRVIITSASSPLSHAQYLTIYTMFPCTLSPPANTSSGIMQLRGNHSHNAMQQSQKQNFLALSSRARKPMGGRRADIACDKD